MIAALAFLEFLIGAFTPPVLFGAAYIGQIVVAVIQIVLALVGWALALAAISRLWPQWRR